MTSVIDIKFSGICHSDIHTVRSEWGEANYPVVPGHEIAGVVRAVGSKVSKHKVATTSASVVLSTRAVSARPAVNISSSFAKWA